MFCGKCGRKLPEDVDFCPMCGAKVKRTDSDDVTHPPVEQKITLPAEENNTTVSAACAPNDPARAVFGGATGKKLFNKKLLIPVAIVALVAVIAVAIFRVGNSTQSAAADDPICYLSDGVFHIQDAKGKMLGEKSTSSNYYWIRNAVGSANFVVSGIDGTYYWDGRELQWLYFCSSKLLSLDGSAVAYVSSFKRTTNGDEDNAVHLQELHLYQRGIGSKTIVGESPEESIVLRCVSPDGSCIGYTIRENDVIDGYIYMNSQATKLGTNKFPIAISKDGKYVYYIKYEGGSTGTLYVQSGTDNESRAKIGDEFYYGLDGNYAYNTECFIFLNRDGTEAIAQVGNGTFYCKGNTNAERISTDLLYPMIPSEYTNILEDDLLDNAYVSHALFMPWADSINSQPFISVNYYEETIDVIKLTEGPTLNTIIRSIRIEDDAFYELSSDMKTIVYLDDHILYRYSVDEDKSERIASEVASFTASGDGKTVFYINEDREMYRKPGDDRASFLIDNIDDSMRYLDSLGSWSDQYNRFYGVYYPSHWSVYDDALYYAVDSTLYVFGENTTTEVLNGRVDACRRIGKAIYVTTWDGDRHYYVSFDGKEYTKVTHNGL